MRTYALRAAVAAAMAVSGMLALTGPAATGAPVAPVAVVAPVANGYTFPPCATEDSQWCYWDATSRGNRRGRSFVAGAEGQVIYLP